MAGNVSGIYIWFAFSNRKLRLYFGCVRRRGELHCGESIPIHQLAILHVTQLVGAVFSIEMPFLKIALE